MKKLTKMINGVEFTIQRTLCEKHNWRERTLTDCYTKPSCTKKAIYEDWKKWFKETANVGYMGVYSYNTNIFTLDGLYTDEETGVNYLVLIYPTHNDLVPLNDEAYNRYIENMQEV